MKHLKLGEKFRVLKIHTTTGIGSSFIYLISRENNSSCIERSELLCEKQK